MNNSCNTPEGQDADTDEKFDIEPCNVLNSGKDEAGLILTGRGRAHVQNALNGAQTIINILHQAEIEDDMDRGFKVKSGTKFGLLQALAACHDVLDERLQGRSVFDDAQFVDCDSQAYQHMLAVQKFAGVEKEQRRAALVQRMDKGAK